MFYWSVSLLLYYNDYWRPLPWTLNKTSPFDKTLHEPLRTNDSNKFSALRHPTWQTKIYVLAAEPNKTSCITAARFISFLCKWRARFTEAFPTTCDQIYTFLNQHASRELNAHPLAFETRRCFVKQTGLCEKASGTRVISTPQGWTHGLRVFSFNISAWMTTTPHLPRTVEVFYGKYTENGMLKKKEKKANI